MGERAYLCDRLAFAGHVYDLQSPTLCVPCVRACAGVRVCGWPAGWLGVNMLMPVLVAVAVALPLNKRLVEYLVVVL